MNTRIWKIVCAAALVVSCSGTDGTLTGNGAGTDSIEFQGQNAVDGTYPAATDFTLKDVNGNDVKLSSLRGKPVFLNFWATWCGPCVAEMPAMDQLHKDVGTQVHMVCVNLRENRTTVNQFLSGKGYGWTFLFDSDGAVSQAYSVSAIPTTYVIDAEGRVRQKHVGSMNYASMRSLVTASM